MFDCRSINEYKKCQKGEEMYLISILIVIIANVGYILFQDSIPSNIDPIVALCCMYFSGMITALILFFFTKQHKKINRNTIWNWRILAFSFVNILIDAGFLIAFRYGWQVSLFNVISNVLILIGLTLVGVLFFKEKLSPINLIGLLLGVIGIGILSV